MSICFLCHFVSILNIIFLNSIGALCFVMLSHLMPCHAMPCHAMFAPHLLAHVGPLSEASFFASSAWHRQCNGTPWHEGHSDRGKEQTDSTSGPQTYLNIYTCHNNTKQQYKNMLYIFCLYICIYVNKYIYISFMWYILYIHVKSSGWTGPQKYKACKGEASGLSNSITCAPSVCECHMSHVTRRMSHVACHMSHVTCHMSCCVMATRLVVFGLPFVLDIWRPIPSSSQLHHHDEIVQSEVCGDGATHGGGMSRSQ